MTTRYIAQTAGVFSGGTHCNGQTAITPATWNSTSEVAGDISYVCGTLTFATNATGLTFSWSGSSGNPIQLIFDTNGVMTSPHFVAAININAQNWITIDGGGTGVSGYVGTGTTNSFVGNGKIQNTLTGSSNATCIGGPCTITTTGDRLIAVPSSSNIVIKNLQLIGSWVHVPANGTSAGGASDQAAITLCTGACGGGGGGSNITVTNNYIIDTITAVYYTPNNGASNVTVSFNTIVNSDAGVYWALGGGQSGYSFTGLYEYNNIVNNQVNWNDLEPGQGPGPETNHHDGLYHLFLTASNQTVSSCYVYNNYFTGDFGEGTGLAYTETYSSGSASTCYVFNNVLAPTASTNGNGFGGLYIQSDGVGHPTAFWYNNTIITNSSTNMEAMNLETGGYTVTMENNVMQGGLAAINFDGTSQLPSVSDYNDFVLPFSNGMISGNLSYGSLSAWQSGSSKDAHSISVAPNLNSNFVPNTGSPLIGAGINLFSTCNGQPNPGLGALCFDAAGNARPSSGAWTIGALNTSGGTSNVAISPTSNSFGNTAVGASKSAVFVLTNSGVASATISSVTFTGSNPGDFSQSNNCGGTIGPSSSCNITVLFSPAIGGNRSATLTVNDTDSSSPQTATLTGTGVVTDSFAGTSSFVFNMTSGWRITKY